MKKQILSIVLAMCMVLTLAPTMAFAESFGELTDSVSDDEMTIADDEVTITEGDTSTGKESDTVDNEAADEYSSNALENESFLGSSSGGTLKTDTLEGEDISPSAPTSVVLTYGDVIEEAKLSGQTGNGTWTFEEPYYAPSYADYKAGQTFRMKFTPYDTTSNRSIYADVKITELKKKPITVYIDDKEMTYGEEIPGLTFSFDEDLLVGEDTVDDLKIKLDFDKDYSTSGRLKAGQYVIKGSSESDMYDINFSSWSGYNGSLLVHRRLLEVEWTDTRNLVYTGEPLTVRATISGILKGDDCTYTMERGEHEMGPSFTGGEPNIYEAVVAVNGSDRMNYVLPEDDDDKEYETSIQYYIRRNIDTECNFPTKVVLTYGQKLSEATFIGESAAEGGRFAFVKMDERHHILEYIDDEIPEPGDYSYKIVYFPPYMEHPVCWGEVSVTVYKKTITITADDKEKTFGEDTPKLTYTADETALVGEDRISDLGISLTAGEGDDKFCDAGNYKITLASTVSSDKYNIKINPSRLTVSKKSISINWPTGFEFIYNGEAINIYAEAVLPEGLPEKAQCQVIVTGGKRTNVGSYTARAVALDNPNYKLSENAQKTFDYMILKAIPSVTFPEKAVITYGQTLLQATFEGGSSSVPGEFIFTEKQEEILGVSDSGNSYSIKFVPEDAENYFETVFDKEQKTEVPVIINPKRITLNAIPGRKTYGEETVLDFALDEESGAKLVGDDTKKDLDVVLTAVSTDEKNTSDGDGIRSPAGVYEIQLKSCGSSNYDVTVIPAEFRIERKTVKLIWSDETEFKFNGKPVNITAKAEGVIPGDECLVNIVNGDRTQPGTYYAQAVSLTNDNYKLPEDSSLLSKKYSIIETSSGKEPVINGTNSVSTGDMTGATLVLFIILFGASFAVILATVIYRRRSMR